MLEYLSDDETLLSEEGIKKLKQMNSQLICNNNSHTRKFSGYGLNYFISFCKSEVQDFLRFPSVKQPDELQKNLSASSSCDNPFFARSSRIISFVSIAYHLNKSIAHRAFSIKQLVVAASRQFGKLEFSELIWRSYTKSKYELAQIILLQ